MPFTSGNPEAYKGYWFKYVQKDSAPCLMVSQAGTSAASLSGFFTTLPGQQLLSGMLCGVVIESLESNRHAHM